MRTLGGEECMQPVQTEPADSAQWAELARLKLDVQRLDDAPLPLSAHFAPGQGGDAAGRGAAGPALQVRRRFRIACGSCARSAGQR